MERPLRRAGIGANLLAGENLAAELKRLNYSEVAIGKILGDSLLQIVGQSCHCQLLTPMTESNGFFLCTR